MSASYREAGVDIEKATLAKSKMGALVRSTYGPEVLGGHGRFGGLFDAGRLQTARHPVLVASTDGVGTKTMVAAAVGRCQSLGYDLVNHCVNDILVQGARPLFFLDYVASSQLDPERVLQVVQGIAEACREAGCALLGGETAEMPGVYRPGELDLAGTIVGWVERDDIIDGSAIAAGDILIGLPSSGLHTNGYSLARHVLADIPLEQTIPELGMSLADALLVPHRSYLAPVTRLISHMKINGLAHITGGGFYDNIPRALPEGLGVTVWRDTWPALPVFKLIQDLGRVSDEEMHHVFNMGIGLVIILARDQVDHALDLLAGEGYRLGEVVPWSVDSRETTEGRVMLI